MTTCVWCGAEIIATRDESDDRIWTHVDNGMPVVFCRDGQHTASPA